MKLSDEHKRYLADKHRGGINNQKGNTYECNYATKEIVRLFASGADVYGTRIGAQLPDTFVDDFCIISANNLITYHQIKDRQNLSWGKNQPRNLIYDFIWQKEYSTANSEAFRLKVVCSDKDCSVVATSIPTEISEVTEVEYFPAYKRLEVMLLDSEEIQRDLKKIMNYPGDVFPLDMQSGCLELIRSQWMELSSGGSILPLVSIQEAYDRKHPGCPNFRSVSDVHLSTAAIEVLQKFPEFQYSVKGTDIFWKYKRMEGNIPVDDLEAALEGNSPQSILELLTILN